jgi:hypothetical protein
MTARFAIEAPVRADFESWQRAPLEQSIERRSVDAQILSQVADVQDLHGHLIAFSHFESTSTRIRSLRAVSHLLDHGVEGERRDGVAPVS